VRTGLSHPASIRERAAGALTAGSEGRNGGLRPG
jgi:hypothetical protein